MKKAISVLLAAVLLFASMAISVNAEADREQKYSTALQTKLSKLQPEESVNIAVWLNDPVDIRYERKADDFADVQEYIEWKRATDREYYLEKNRQYADMISASASVQVSYLSKYSPSVFLTAAASEVSKIAELDFVSYLDWLSEKPLTQPTDDGTYLYADRFANWIKLPEYDPKTMSDFTYGTYDNYDELYYHTSVLGAKPDWTLVRAHVEMYNTWEKVEYKKIGNRVLVSWRPGAGALAYELAVYDTENGTFYALENSAVSSESYDGLAEALDLLGLGYRLGDTDMDGEIEITDVTVIQRCLVSMAPPAGNAYRGAVFAIGDLDGDGMDISDATSIQRFLAGMRPLYL